MKYIFFTYSSLFFATMNENNLNCLYVEAFANKTNISTISIIIFVGVSHTCYDKRELGLPI